MAKLVRPEDYLVAADGGTRHCLEMGFRPNMVVGDFDSLSKELQKELTLKGVVIERYPPDKDKTDLELALDRSLRIGADKIMILGAWGGRPDHTIGNLLLLAREDINVPVEIVQESQIITVLGPGRDLSLSCGEGDLLSVVPLSAKVTGVTYRGLKYPLTNATLERGRSTGLSNVVVATPASIRVGQGWLAVFQGAPR